VAYLLWKGQLPGQRELDRLNEELRECAHRHRFPRSSPSLPAPARISLCRRTVAVRTPPLPSSERRTSPLCRRRRPGYPPYAPTRAGAGVPGFLCGMCATTIKD
jgi:hypothetical protein